MLMTVEQIRCIQCLYFDCGVRLIVSKCPKMIVLLFISVFLCSVSAQSFNEDQIFLDDILNDNLSPLLFIDASNHDKFQHISARQSGAEDGPGKVSSVVSSTGPNNATSAAQVTMDGSMRKALSTMRFHRYVLILGDDRLSLWQDKHE